MYDKGERYYEDTAVYGATIDDIDMDAVADYAKLVGYGKSPLQYLRENNGFVRTNKKAAIKREQRDARISSAEREQARLEVNGEEEFFSLANIHRSSFLAPVLASSDMKVLMRKWVPR